MSAPDISSIRGGGIRGVAVYAQRGGHYQQRAGPYKAGYNCGGFVVINTFHYMLTLFTKGGKLIIKVFPGGYGIVIVYNGHCALIPRAQQKSFIWARFLSLLKC